MPSTICFLVIVIKMWTLNFDFTHSVFCFTCCKETAITHIFFEDLLPFILSGSSCSVTTMLLLPQKLVHLLYCCYWKMWGWCYLD